MLEARNLECVRGNRRLFRSLSFSARPGELIQVTGPNGSGKTSLLRMLCGLLPPTNGEVRWQGHHIASLGGEYLERVSYLGHRPAAKDEFTALENLRVSMGLHGVELAVPEAIECLRRAGLGGFERARAQFLSEGQRRRLAMARLVARRAPLWLLDEALTALDGAGVELLRTLLGEHLERGGMAIVVTHQEVSFGAAVCRQLDLAS